MNKKLMLSLGAALATTLVAAGGTYALFSATAPASAPITAGNLCLDSARDAFDTVPGPMFYMTAAQGMTSHGELGKYPTAEVSPNSPAGYIPPTPGGWAPGDSVTRTLTVYNGRADCGTTSLEAKLVSISANWHAGSGSYDPLADKLQVTVLAQPAAGGGGSVTVAQGSLRQFMQPGGVQVLYPGGGGHPLIPAWLGGPMPNLQMQFQVNFDLDTPNAYQDKTAIVDFSVYAEQARNNP
jgi:predicted ribosomally synthesized peptide with SipW-like signal peptide